VNFVLILLEIRLAIAKNGPEEKNTNKNDLSAVHNS
jgi:hypothetical protein